MMVARFSQALSPSFDAELPPIRTAATSINPKRSRP
jgi:hypothetical protein